VPAQYASLGTLPVCTVRLPGTSWVCTARVPLL